MRLLFCRLPASLLVFLQLLMVKCGIHRGLGQRLQSLWTYNIGLGYNDSFVFAFEYHWYTNTNMHACIHLHETFIQSSPHVYSLYVTHTDRNTLLFATWFLLRKGIKRKAAAFQRRAQEEREAYYSYHSSSVTKDTLAELILSICEDKQLLDHI